MSEIAYIRETEDEEVSMSAGARLLSESELEVLKVLWETGPAPVRGLLDQLGERGSTWAYTTVQTLLGRLQEKGFVTSEKRGRAFVFSAAVSQDDLVGQHLDDLASRVCEGASTPLVWNLVQRGKLSKKDLKALRGLLDELDGEAR